MLYSDEKAVIHSYHIKIFSNVIICVCTYRFNSPNVLYSHLKWAELSL